MVNFVGRKRKALMVPNKRRIKKNKRSIKFTDRAKQGNNPANLVTFRGFGFPDTLRTNLIYSDSIVLTPSVGTPTPSYAYRLTSLFDPDLTGIGGQPYWFDQLSAVYGRYQVLGAKITAIFSYSNAIASGIGPTIVGIETGEISSLSSTSAAVLRMSGNVTSNVLTTQSEPKEVVATYSPRQSYGNQLTDALTAGVTGNPSRNWNAVVFASPQGTDVTTPINCMVTIEYFAEFTQQSQNAGS